MMSIAELRGRLDGDTVLRAIALAAWLFVCIMVVLGLAFWLARGSPRLPVSYVGGALGTAGVVLCGLVFSTAAAYLMARAPRNVIGWVFMAIGLGMAVVLPINIALADVVSQYRLVETPVVWLAWAVTSTQVPVSGTALVVVLLLFPSGRPECRHWRPVMAMAVAGGVLISAGAALRPDGLLWYPALPNPLDVPREWRGALAACIWLDTALLVVALAAAGMWLAWRARRANGVQRRQLAWVVTGGLIMCATLAPLFVVRYIYAVGDAAGERLVFAACVGGVALPFTVAMAVQREGLFGLRDLLGRSLVYVPLTAVLAGLYSAAVMVLQKLFVALTGTTSDGAVILSTLLVVASLTPARNMLEGIVRRSTQGQPDRLEHNGQPHEACTAAQTTANLAERLQWLEARVADLAAPSPGGQDQDLPPGLRTVETLER
jgi:two-component system, NarL family, sensor kinase